jgi:hypothetical protein
VNKTPGTSKARGGRPRQELTPTRKRELEHLAARVAAHHGDLRSARADLVASARDAAAEGASVRAIAEAVRLSRPRVHELLNDEHDPR